MDRKDIVDNVGNLPTINMGEVPGDDECWEGDDGEAHYIVTRAHLPGFSGMEIVHLSVSGPPAARRDLIRDFCDLLGTPAMTKVEPEDPIAIDDASWVGLSLRRKN